MPRYDTQIVKHKRDRSDLVEKSRKIMDKAEAEKRALTAEERAEFDQMSGAIDEHEDRISDLEKLNKDDDPDEGDDEKPVDPAAPDKDDEGGRSRRRATAPIDFETRDDSRTVHGTAAYRKAFRRYLATGQTRDLVMGTQASGGALVAPVQMSEDIVRQIDNLVFIRPLARIYKLVNAQAIGVRQIVTRLADSAWTTEIGQLTADQSMAFASRLLSPNLLSKLVLASIRLVESGVDIEPMINEEMAYKNGIAEENAFLNGSGSGQPLGVYTASANGVPTSQDVTSTVTAGFNGDDLIKMKYSLKQPYFAGDTCRWVMGRPIAQATRTLKDSYGQYLWRAGLASDRPDTILDVPLAISEYSPVVETSGSYIACLGNFRYYAIAELKDFWIQRLVERYADTNEIGFIGRRFVDGAPVLGEAFVRLKTA